MKIVICDDSEFEIEILKKLCEEYVSENNLEAEIICTDNPGRIKAEEPDILILDIEMPEKSGIEIKNELAEGDRPLIIFATAYFEFMREAFGRNVIGYMEKPVKKYEFNNQQQMHLPIQHSINQMRGIMRGQESHTQLVQMILLFIQKDIDLQKMLYQIQLQDLIKRKLTL